MCRGCLRLFRPSTSPTCFNIHSIWWSSVTGSSKVPLECTVTLHLMLQIGPRSILDRQGDWHLYTMHPMRSNLPLSLDARCVYSFNVDGRPSHLPSAQVESGFPIMHQVKVCLHVTDFSPFNSPFYLISIVFMKNGQNGLKPILSVF